MPQVRCPNCGLSINLENRKHIDCNLIMSATKNKPRTFTELLRVTKLPRKTLSLRLKEMCTNGTLIKSESMYKLNKASDLGKASISSQHNALNLLRDKRFRTGLMLILLLVISSASGYALATFFAKQEEEGPKVIGYFTMALDISSVDDLYGWQVLVVYDATELEIQDVVPGGFVGSEYPSPETIDFSEGIFVTATDIPGELWLYGSLLKKVVGKSGGGRLATITFGYFTENYEGPTIASGDPYVWFKDSYGSTIPIGSLELTFSVIEE